MTTTITSRGVYDLLPAELRRLDGESDGAVQALVRILAEQLATVEADIDRLGEDWFIETCAEWVVPYLGDLLGARGIHQIATAGATAARARIANTLRFRRRKGTLAMLEQLARDATGWPAKAVEFFELLSATAHPTTNGGTGRPPRTCATATPSSCSTGRSTPSRTPWTSDPCPVAGTTSRTSACSSGRSRRIRWTVPRYGRRPTLTTAATTRMCSARTVRC
jgi:hypothetical protein